MFQSCRWAATLTALTAALALAPAVTSPAHASACPLPTVYQPLKQYVANFVASANSVGEGYDVPSPSEVTSFTDGLFVAMRGVNRTACSYISPLSYDVLTLVDGSRPYTVLREHATSSGKYAHGWGLIVIDRFSTAPELVIEAPHACPLAKGGCAVGDKGVEYVAAEAMRLGVGRALVVAGASRQANGVGNTTADSAHNHDGMFEKIHEFLVGYIGAGIHVYQPHGYAAGSHKDLPAGTMTVVSSGSSATSAAAHSVMTAVRNAGLHPCLYSGVAKAYSPTDSQTPSGSCSNLGATSNVQGQHMGGGTFLHIEADGDAVNENASNPTRLAQAVVSVFH